jgi:fatty-acyl-CoA synthase
MEVMKKVVEQMGVTEILVGYGQTEASSWVTLTRPDDPLEVRVSTIGRALEMTEIKIVDPVTGEEAASGQTGEMCTRGFLMKGYYRMPAATAQAIDGNGWLHTGDMVILDESGNGKVLGRIKDLISKNGRDISPVDIEEALFGHPEVVEAAAFGMPGRDGNELVAAWVKVKPGALATTQGVIDYCRNRLPDWAVPDIVHFTEYFPMTATGKIQKFKMQDITRRLLDVAGLPAGEAGPGGTA